MLPWVSYAVDWPDLCSSQIVFEHVMLTVPMIFLCQWEKEVRLKQTEMPFIWGLRTAIWEMQILGATRKLSRLYGESRRFLWERRGRIYDLDKEKREKKKKNNPHLLIQLVELLMVRGFTVLLTLANILGMLGMLVNYSVFIKFIPTVLWSECHLFCWILRATAFKQWLPPAQFKSPLELKLELKLELQNSFPYVQKFYTILHLCLFLHLVVS